MIAPEKLSSAAAAAAERPVAMARAGTQKLMIAPEKLSSAAAAAAERPVAMARVLERELRS